jgi:hypothetical protein
VDTGCRNPEHRSWEELSVIDDPVAIRGLMDHLWMSRNGTLFAGELPTLSILETQLNRLTPARRHTIVRRFGLDGKPRRTYSAIAKERGITKERVRQTSLAAVRQLSVWFSQSLAK